MPRLRSAERIRPGAKEPLVHPKGTDTFELTGLRGPMVLHASMSGALLVSISREGGEDLAGKPLHFTGTEMIDDLLVVFTNEKAEVEVGHVSDGTRQPRAIAPARGTGHGTAEHPGAADLNLRLEGSIPSRLTITGP